MTDQTSQPRWKPGMAKSLVVVLTAGVVLGGSVLLSGCAKKSVGKSQTRHATPHVHRSGVPARHSRVTNTATRVRTVAG